MKIVLNFKSHFFSSIVFKNDSTIFYNPNGTLHLFEIHLGDKTKVSKISTSVHSGHILIDYYLQTMTSYIVLEEEVYLTHFLD